MSEGNTIWLDLAPGVSIEVDRDSALDGDEQFFTDLYARHVTNAKKGEAREWALGQINERAAARSTPRIVSSGGYVPTPEQSRISEVEADLAAARRENATLRERTVTLAADLGAVRKENDDRRETCEALVLTWRCEACGWETTLPVPGFGGNGRVHFPDGRTACGPLFARRAASPAAEEPE